MPKKKKSLTEGLERVLDKIADRMPDNIKVDVKELAVMGAAGVGSYYAAPYLHTALALFIRKSAEAFPGDQLNKNQERALDAILNGSETHYDEELGMDVTIKREDFITEDVKIATALFGAVLIPKLPELTAAFGELIKGVGEMIPG